ncbi:uncharacterized protein AB675_8424 [Cyphellophora attinorum]|uniref:AB hydrolase-1 domain-containing protein n=1 Tax=Cyphellophora attinorum TaxID=1664694 RepID=A0A0N1HFU0_9EURO|nr:uncharacterized protein AB675_8424 [Phialophora attinorum]KPI44763.1 hypothetical protein AB675_8424 [Phialophora attinorum]
MTPKPKRPPTANPVEYTYDPPPSSTTMSSSSSTSTPLPSMPSHSSVSDSIPHPGDLSRTTVHIAGILTHIHGLAELPPACTEVAVLWLLHPRLQTAECMWPFAAHLVRHHYDLHARRGTSPKLGFIAVSFDQRNHGTRLVDAHANKAWRDGNERHAQDMFSCFAGTAQDTSLLLDFLPAYAFPDGGVEIVRNMVLGVSLGGHAAWQICMRDPGRFQGVVVVIGCPDYTRLMVDRARLSKRKLWLEGKGEGFVGSADWPQGLVEAVRGSHPAEYFSGILGREGTEHAGKEDWAHEMSEEEAERVRPEMERCFGGGKRVLVLSGGSDKLVNYKFSEPFLGWLKKAIQKRGWFEDGGLWLKDVVVEGCGHEVPPVMVGEMLEFVEGTMGLWEEEVSGAKEGKGISDEKRESTESGGSRRSSKI